MVWMVVLCWAGFMSFCCVVVYAVTGTWLIVLVCRVLGCAFVGCLFVYSLWCFAC